VDGDLFFTSRMSLVTDDMAVAIQYSVIDGRVGFDWVLLGSRNIADKAKVATFIKHRGHAIAECRMNRVSYLRVEDGDLAGLGQDIVTKFYGENDDLEIGLLMDKVQLPLGWQRDD
jgi:hypothetical protein